MDLDEALPTFACPRCGASTDARFYGPCPRCRSELVASQAGKARKLDTERFEPAVHVVPNQVATKE